MRELPKIPLIDLGRRPVAELAAAAGGRLDDILRHSLVRYGRHALRHGDRATRLWLRRHGNPYRHEIRDIAAGLADPGAYLLNLSYEWSCTCGVAPDPGAKDASRLLRTLDWPLDGLGRNIVVARIEGDAGPYYNVTWPGFVGVMTAMAPGRFSAAINQPPMRRYSRSCHVDWAVNRIGVWRKGGLPPAHLLRRVFDRCRTYDEAVKELSEARLCLPAFFSISGLGAEQGCVIERTEQRAAVRPAPAAAANHWVAMDETGMGRGFDSSGRLDQMQSGQERAGDDFNWLTPPILNVTTRLAVIASAAPGGLRVQGWESDGPATTPFRLDRPL